MTAATVANWHRAGHIAAHRTPGGHRRIHRDEVLRFAREHGLPVAELDRPAAAEGADRGGRRVLVVDPERDFCETVSAFLEARTDLEVRYADSAFEAGVELGRFQPDLVVFALEIPGLDLRSLDRACGRLGSDPRIIVCTAAPDRALEAGGGPARVRRVYRKPVQLDELEQGIAAVLDEARAG